MPHSVVLHCSCGTGSVMWKKLKTNNPDGRMVYKLACSCGRTAPQWSESTSDAVGMWNKTIEDGTE